MLDLRDASAAPASLPLERLEGEIVRLSSHLAAAMCRWLLLVAEFDRREGWGSWECVSCAQWLAWKCGISPTTAREHVRVARALEGLPKITERFGEGSLSYSKVRALTRVATAEVEGELLVMAEAMTAGQLDQAMRACERAFRPPPPGPDGLVGRVGADRWPNDDGTYTWMLRVSPETDALLRREINWVREQDYEAARAAGEPTEGRGGRLPRVDAIATIVEMAARERNRPDTVAATTTAMVVTVEGPAVVGEDGMVHLDGMVLHPSLARRLGCDVELQLAGIGEAGHAMNMGRRVRTFTRNQKTALAALFPTCGFPGCEVPSWMCAFHHIVPWWEGGLTDLDNGVPVCARHHRAVHDGGWRLFKDHMGHIVAIGPGGRSSNDHRLGVPAGAPPLEQLNAAAGVTVRPDLDPPYERTGLHWAIDSLITNLGMRRN